MLYELVASVVLLAGLLSLTPTTIREEDVVQGSVYLVEVGGWQSTLRGIHSQK